MSFFGRGKIGQSQDSEVLHRQGEALVCSAHFDSNRAYHMLLGSRSIFYERIKKYDLTQWEQWNRVALSISQVSQDGDCI